ncbi:MAG TPA: PEP-utilizing enzyme [Acidimicrobiales bacterium]
MDVTWEEPGPGQWDLDRSHGYGSATPITQRLMSETMEAGMRELFADFGMPADTIGCRFVNGYMYNRLKPLIGADKPPRKPPPAFALKLAFKLHPELRRRGKRAKETVDNQPWHEVIRHWRDVERPAIQQQNLALQMVDLASLDDAALADHVQVVYDHAHRLFQRHFVLHGHDLGPIGMLLLDCRNRWGIEPADVVPALRGASPSTSEPARMAARLREAVLASGTTPDSLEDVRALGPALAGELDSYLQLKGQTMVSRYDVDGLRLIEMPDLVLATIVAGSDPDDDQGEAAAQALRALVPEADRAELDRLLREARAAMDLRDDNGPTTAEWPLGLLRRALLEAGDRLQGRGALVERDHVFELDLAEVLALVRSQDGPTGDVAASRARRRAELSTLTPPSTLGSPEPPPPAGAMPPATKRMIDIVQIVMEQLGGGKGSHDLSGSGVGTQPYRGRVRRALSAEQALDRLEPGEILVVPYTTPAYNMVMPIAGGLVTSEGGPLSHASVIARELGIPAVIGAPGALIRLHDGDEVEIDPAAGEVRILQTADRAPV